MRRWFLKLIFRENSFVQKVHLYGFSPVWVRTWTFRCDRWLKILPHISHLYGNSPETTQKNKRILCCYQYNTLDNFMDKPLTLFGPSPQRSKPRFLQNIALLRYMFIAYLLFQLSNIFFVTNSLIAQLKNVSIYHNK